MSTKRIRRTYTPDFKNDAIDLVIKNEYSCNEAARRLGIGSSMLARCLRESRDDEAALEAGQPTTKELKDEIRQLKAENKRLEMEREILKGGGLLCERSELKFDFIRQQMKAFPVAILCRVMGASRSGFYDYLKRLPTPPDQAEKELEDATKSIL